MRRKVFNLIFNSNIIKKYLKKFKNNLDNRNEKSLLTSEIKNNIFDWIRCDRNTCPILITYSHRMESNTLLNY
jgi:hypothetical protein